MAGPSPGLSGSGIWAAIQILPTTDGPLGRACPVGLQPTDLIRGRPRPHQNQLRRGEDVDARAKPAQGVFQEVAAHGSSNTLTLCRNLNRTAVVGMRLSVV